MFITHRLIIRIENRSKAGRKWRVSHFPARKNKGFEKLAGMTQMPFYGTGIGHGLHTTIFCRQIFNQAQRFLPD
jgi:hypothetical protein